MEPLCLLAILNFLFAGEREVQFRIWRFFILLDEPMQRVDFARMKAKKYTSDGAIKERCSNFKQAFAHGFGQRHPDWPWVLRALQILTDRATIGLW